MSSLRKLFFVIASVALVLPTFANAADIIDYIPEPDPIPYGGWYLRGDIGMKVYQAPKASLNYPGVVGTHINESLDSTFLVGAGVGYRWNGWFRTDATVDYEFKAGFDADAECLTVPCGGGGVYSRESADIDAWTVMLNAYFDLGTWHSVTPYVGAGAGAAYVSTSNLVSRNPDGTVSTHDGDGKWNFAWALMAGAAFDLSPNMTLDAGYQFRSLGSAHSSVLTSVSTGTERVKYEDIYAHELRVGLRYNFN